MTKVHEKHELLWVQNKTSGRCAIVVCRPVNRSDHDVEEDEDNIDHRKYDSATVVHLVAGVWIEVQGHGAKAKVQNLVHETARRCVPPFGAKVVALQAWRYYGGRRFFAIVQSFLPGLGEVS